MQDDEEGVALAEDAAFIDDEGVAPEGSDDESYGGSGVAICRAHFSALLVTHERAWRLFAHLFPPMMVCNV